MSTRDELADLINEFMESDVPESVPDKHEPLGIDYAAADAILAAGWRPPARIVTTVDQLAALLADDWAPDRDPILTAMFRDYAQTILDAGWRPPARTVTTVEELDALPVGSIVRDVERSALDEKWDDNMWAEVAYESTFSSSSIHTPATVLWEPEEAE